MNTSFWTGAVGANAANKKLSVASNNLANVNTNGFKAQEASFMELINYNLNDSREATTNLHAGAGARVARTPVNFSTSGFAATGSLNDFAIGQDNAFFMIQDPATGDITYTRDGHFHISTENRAPEGDDETGAKCFLVTQEGKYVLDQFGKPVEAENVPDMEKLLRDSAKIMGSEDAEEEEEETTDEDEDSTEEKPHLAVYTLPHPSRLLLEGANEYRIADGDTLNTPVVLNKPVLQQGYLETSGTDMAQEMTRVIEGQRAFAYALRMVTTSDEIEGTINQLRN